METVVHSYFFLLLLRCLRVGNRGHGGSLPTAGGQNIQQHVANVAGKVAHIYKSFQTALRVALPLPSLPVMSHASFDPEGKEIFTSLDLKPVDVFSRKRKKTPGLSFFTLHTFQSLATENWVQVLVLR